jgi:hypothetical protein
MKISWMKARRGELVSLMLVLALSGCAPPPLVSALEPSELRMLSPTRQIAGWTGLMSIDELTIPQACVRRMMFLPDPEHANVSPSGEWVVVRHSKHDHHIFVPFPVPDSTIFFYNLETRKYGLLPNTIGEDLKPKLADRLWSPRWDASGSGLYYLSSEEIDHVDLTSGALGRVRKDCPGCNSIAINERLGVIAVTRQTSDWGPVGHADYELNLIRWSESFSNTLLTMRERVISMSNVSLSPGGWWVSYEIERWERDEQGKSQIRAYRRYVELADWKIGKVITSTKNRLTDFWVMDGVVVEPDLEALQILRHDLRTGERVVLARLAPDALAEEKKKGVEYESVYSVMIGGREQQYLLFQPGYFGGPLHIADLACSLQLAHTERAQGEQ